MGKPKHDKAAIVPGILEMLENGDSLRKACAAAKLPVPTFLLWVENDEALAEQYARARDKGNAQQFEELQEIADEMPPTTASGSIDSGWIQWQKLRIDTAKWILSKKQPRKYGDKLDVTSNGQKVGLAINIDLGGSDAG